MARTKNTKRKPAAGSRYPLAEYGKLEKNELTDCTNSHETNTEFIRQLLNKLIDKIISISDNTEKSPSSIVVHEETTSNTGNKNVESLEQEANKENELTQQMHDNNESTNCELHITNILKEAQENKKIVNNENQTELMRPTILSETVASTKCPTHVKTGKPLSFYQSYYVKQTLIV